MTRSDFDNLYRTHYKAAMSRAWKLTRNREDAEDLTQMTFARAWASGETVRDVGALSRWLFKVMNNIHLDNLRLKNRRIRALHFDAIDIEDDQLRFFADDQFEREVFAHHPGEIAATALDAMTNRERDLMHEVFVEGDNFRMAAERRGVTRQSVAKQANRAIEKARKAVLL